jgi:hypothetical protein
VRFNGCSTHCLATRSRSTKTKPTSISTPRLVWIR